MANKITFQKNKKFDVICIGRILVDLNPLDYYRTLSQSMTYKKYIGGSPANIATGLVRLGKRVGFIGCVSDDQFGDFAYDFFGENGIDTSHVYRTKNGENMSLTFTEILSETESNLLMYRNSAADLSLTTEMIDESYIKEAKILVASGTALSQSPSREATLKAVQLAKKNNVFVVFDIDERNYLWRNTDERSLYYSYAANFADLIIGSREEFDLMDSLLYPRSDDRETSARWLGKGAQIVIIKHGKEGSTAFMNEGSYKIKPFPVKAFKSTGGGDGYVSAFIYGLLEGMDITKCLEYGSASASILVSSHGCSAYMPYMDEIKNFIIREKEEYGEMIARSQ